MKSVSYRVTPVVRYNITKRESDPANGAGSVGSIGEFTNESYAEEIAAALRAAEPKPMQYAIIERTSFATSAMVYYASDPDQAAAYMEQLQSHFGLEFRIFEQELVDPVAIALHETRGPATFEKLNLPDKTSYRRGAGFAFAKAAKDDPEFLKEMESLIFGKARESGLDEKAANSLSDALVVGFFGI